jgi:DNA-directed RNA polymerase specialized sigma24 family protein
MTTQFFPPHLASPATRRLLTRYVARRVPACDVDDVVQATLCDAVASGRAPLPDEDFRRWVLSIARFKVVDAHRAAARTAEEGGVEAVEPAAPAPPLEARSLLRWAARQLPRGAEATLRWMLREAEGEKLEAIAAAETLPAERVRQRVSRLRRFLRERWLDEVAALMLVLLAVLGGDAAFPRRERILPEAGFAASPTDARLLGSWALVRFDPAAPLPAVRRALVDRVGPTLVASFDGATLVAGGAGNFGRRYVARRAEGGALEAWETTAGHLAVATYAFDGDELVLTVPSGAWAGVARFRRVP